MSAATQQAAARREVRAVPEAWHLTDAGVRFTATVEHICNPGRRWTRRITLTSSVSLPYIPTMVHGYLQAKIEDALGRDWPSWTREPYYGRWRTLRHQLYTRNYSAAEIHADVVQTLKRAAARGTASYHPFEDHHLSPHK
jgi:hypothetical protein